MVQRIFSQPGVRSSNPFDPLAISRTAQQASSSASGAFSALDTLQSKQKAFDDQQSEILSRVENQRVEREFVNRQFEADQQEIDSTGANFTKIGQDNYRQRIVEARERLQGNPEALRRFDEKQQLEEQGRLHDLEKEQRKRTQDYWVKEHERSVDDSLQVVSRSPVATTTSPQNNNIDGFLSALGHRESGNRTNIRNSEGFVGRWQMGQARLDDFNRANGTNISLNELQKSASAQEQTIRWHFQDIDKFIDGNDLDRFEGQIVNGVRVTRNGMRAAAHLGGNGGLRKFLTTGKNPSDSNGTRLSDYMKQFGNVTGTEIANYNGDIPDIWKNPIIANERSSAYENIDASTLSTRDKELAKRDIDSRLAQAAIGQISRENPSEALALLQSGDLDEHLTYKEDQSAQNSLIRSLESQIKAQAKAQNDLAKEEATVAAQDQRAFQEGGRVGEPPREVSPEERSILSAGERRSLDASFGVGEAIVAAQNSPINELNAVREQFVAGGQGFANEQKALEAFDKVMQQRFKQQVQNTPLSQIDSLVELAPDGEVRNSVIAEGVRKTKALQNDFVNEAQRSGVGTDPLDPNNLTSSLENRFNQLSDFADQNGVEPKLLSPTEKLQFSESFKEAKVADKMAIMEDLAKMPSEVQEAFYSDISKNSPFLAHAGGVMSSGNSEAVGVALRGLQASNEGRKFEDLQKADINLAVSNTGVASALRGLPDVLRDTQAFALNYARGIAQESGEAVTAESYEKGLNLALGSESSIHEVGGGVFSGGSDIVLPVGVGGDDFDTWFENLNDNSIRSMNNGEIPKDVDGRELDAEYIRDNASLTTVGNGQYAVHFSDGTDAMNSDGSRLILDINNADQFIAGFDNSRFE